MNGRCEQCGKQAVVLARWPVHDEPIEADLCAECADRLWKMFGRTTLFTFSEPEVP